MNRLALMAAVDLALKRQAEIKGDIPRCVRCEADQVQIIDSKTPAEWKCRICKKRFHYEPRTKESSHG